MRLDHTRIAILERNQRDLLDLSFLVWREFFVSITGLILVLAIPLAVFNYFLIHWMAADLVEWSTIGRYAWTMAVLVYLEAPVASVLATAYLGKVTFFEDPPWGELLRDVVKSSHRIIWTQLILRGVLIVIWLIASIEQEESYAPIEALVPFILFGLFIWRSFRPYLNEIVLLERSPIRARSDQEITIGKRSARLHGPNGSDLFGRGVMTLPVAVSLGGAIFGLFWFSIATFSNDWTLGPIMVHVAYPATLWCLVAYMTVLRFLSYLDLRIRREGWEVELKMRAEATRLKERLAFGNG